MSGAFARCVGLERGVGGWRAVAGLGLRSRGVAGGSGSARTFVPGGAPSLRRLLAADSGNEVGVKLYHKVNLGLLGLTPLAIASEGSALSFPVDMALAVAFPLHGHIGMNYVITDYIPKLFGNAARGPARIIMCGVTGLTTLGLVKLNIEGPGITGSLKALWRS